MKNEASDPSDCLVTELLQNLPKEAVYEVTRWFAKLVQGTVPSPRVSYVFFQMKKNQLQFGKMSTRVPCDRERRRSRLSGGICTLEPTEELSVSEHLQALLTSQPQRHWEWEEDRRTDL